MSEILVRANAKINLALTVRYKRGDGYHEIDTIFQEIDFCDDLQLARAKEITFTCDDKNLVDNGTNLCVQAACLLKKAFNIPGIAIKLKKRIPIGAGLGGGSSDAAAVLRGTRDLFNLNVTDKQLLQFAAQLGSDVPFFIRGGSCYARGRGEILKAIALPTDYTILLIMPNIAVSTIWAYKNLKIGLTKEIYDFKFTSFKFHNLAVSSFKNVFFNDFERVVFATYPKLGEIKENLYTQGADFASLSGSGSAVYGIFSSTNKARKVQKAITSHGTCRVIKPIRSFRLS